MGSEESTPSHERQNVSGDDIEKLLEDQRRHIEEKYNNIHREAIRTELKNQELTQTAAREVARNELEKLMREKNNGASTSESHHSSSTRRPWTGKNTMESPRKFNDCYFYYYSTCTKGDNCVFRHEPAALGCETMCTAWQQGKCLDKRCKLRHMELRKNRKQIPCYWENQPGGCRKKHCSFMHKNPEARTDGIAPSQPAPPTPVAPAGGVAGGVGVGESVSEAVAVPQVPQPVPPTAPPVPLMWQQQRQVVTVDSAILGVLPAGGGELLGARRVMPTHAHAHAHAHPHAHAHAHDAPNPYAPHPVDPLVVNFEEESDNESAPSSTPTKTVSSDDAQRIARTKSQELLLLEKIQAEAAAFYSYDNLPPEPNKERKIVRTNLSTKYDRLSLDEIAGKKQQSTERRHSLDFKVLSLEEIRARKKSETVVHTAPITLNLRKRKSSTHETITSSGNKIIKVVRSKSIVYKKLDQNAAAAVSQPKSDQKHAEVSLNRKRTISEQSDLYEIQDDELIDDCFQFKRIKLTEQISKPKLIRTTSFNSSKENAETKDDMNVSSKTDSNSDTEVQIVNVDINDKNLDVSDILDTEIIDVDSAKMGEPVAIVDLSDDSNDVTITDLELGLVKNVPDVVASCRNNTNKLDSSDKDLLTDIDSILDDSL